MQMLSERRKTSRNDTKIKEWKKKQNYTHYNIMHSLQHSDRKLRNETLCHSSIAFYIDKYIQRKVGRVGEMCMFCFLQFCFGVKFLQCCRCLHLLIAFHMKMSVFKYVSCNSDQHTDVRQLNDVNFTPPIQA